MKPVRWITLSAAVVVFGVCALLVSGAYRGTTHASGAAGVDDGVMALADAVRSRDDSVPVATDAVIAESRFRALWSGVEKGDVAAGQEALAWEDRCVSILAMPDRGSASNPDEFVVGDAVLAAHWRDSFSRANSLCTEWRRVQHDPLFGRSRLLDRLASAAESQGIPSWMVSPDVELPPDLDRLEADLRAARDSGIYVEGIRRLLADPERVAALGLDLDSIANGVAIMVVPELAGCIRFGECAPSPVARIGLCLDFYACSPGVRFDRPASAGLLSIAEEQAARRVVLALNERVMTSGAVSSTRP